MLAAWRRYWFSPASLTDLGVSRAVLAGIVLVLNGTTRFVQVGMAAPGLWTPVPILGLLHVPQPDPATLRVMALATAVLLALIVVGVGTRLALVIVLGLELLQEAFLNSLGKVTHATLPLLYALAFFALAPCDRAFSLGAMWRRARRASADPAFTPGPVRTSRFARWPIDLLFIVLAAYYALAGISKLRDAGLAWADGYTLQYHLLDFGSPAGQRLAEHLGLCAALSALVLVFELGFWTGIVRRLRPVCLAGGALFHLGTTWLLNISFWPVVAVYLLFVPWSRLGRGIARLARLDRYRRHVLYDARCSRCRALASIVCDVDLPGLLRFHDDPHGEAPARHLRVRTAGVP
jgi:hypothetical protein